MSVPPEICRERLPALATLEVVFQRFRGEAVTPKAIRDQLAIHRLDWIRVDYRYLAFNDASTGTWRSEGTPVDDSRQLLDDLPVLRLLPAEARKLVVDSFVPASVPFGAPIIREGEPADALYVLVSGRARIVKRADSGEELSLGTLKPGDSFGEMGLLEETIRSATVRASSEVEVLRLDRSVFRALEAPCIGGSAPRLGDLQVADVRLVSATH